MARRLPQCAPLPAPAAQITTFDIGTGTGVLAAALAQHGIPHIVATDMNPRALVCARENLARLELGKQVNVMETDLFPIGQATLVACNPPWGAGTAELGTRTCRLQSRQPHAARFSRRPRRASGAGRRRLADTLQPGRTSRLAHTGSVACADRRSGIEGCRTTRRAAASPACHGPLGPAACGTCKRSDIAVATGGAITGILYNLPLFWMD
ncbi:protein of unknown function [Georgfuchsia toluolica]|uniref:Methyltransferase small domain-containing protein n=1 Tax=Georgfuchsia toluolica TaxID=424218 RepID=A0A916N8T5_9PROT|nr:protein of unknown function [Georgfuchsia toluolica]